MDKVSDKIIEVIRGLENDLIKYNFTVEDVEFQKSIISHLQSYQSLLEKIEVEKLRSANRLTDGQLTPKQAQAIYNYLKEVQSV